MELGQMPLEAAARAAAGNWIGFPWFVWHRSRGLKDAGNWCVVFTHHRDSGLLQQSNAAVIAKALRPFTRLSRHRDVVPECYFHWGHGWMAGYGIRVFKKGRITPSFGAYHELATRLQRNVVLDEDDYLARQREATLENLVTAALRLMPQYQVPANWPRAVYDWFTSNDCGAIESPSDRGGYPTEGQLEAAFAALGYGRAQHA